MRRLERRPSACLDSTHGGPLGSRQPFEPVQRAVTTPSQGREFAALAGMPRLARRVVRAVNNDQQLGYELRFDTLGPARRKWSSDGMSVT
jgi:hypothetical protein